MHSSGWKTQRLTAFAKWNVSPTQHTHRIFRKRVFPRNGTVLDRYSQRKTNVLVLKNKSYSYDGWNGYATGKTEGGEDYYFVLVRECCSGSSRCGSLSSAATAYEFGVKNDRRRLLSSVACSVAVTHNSGRLLLLLLLLPMMTITSDIRCCHVTALHIAAAVTAALRSPFSRVRQLLTKCIWGLFHSVFREAFN